MGKNRLVRCLMSVIVLFVFGFSAQQDVLAEEMPLSVKAILPDNQFKKEASYYHLMMKPGQKQEIELQLFNASDAPVTALVTLTAATTNDNGLIDYNMPDKEIDKSLLYPFSKIATSPKEVTVPAKGEVITKIAIEMPPEEYDGMILGGINVKVKKEKTKDDDQQKSGMKIENEMNYAIGVVLIENENPVEPDMKLQRVYASQINGTNTTKANLQNPTADSIEELTIEAKIFSKNSDKILYEIKKEGYRMAPNSNFDFGIPIGEQRYKAGEYKIKVDAISNPKDGEKKEWNLESTFIIKREEAEKLNQKAVGIPEDYTMYYIIGGAVVLLLIGVGFYYVNQKKKQQRGRNKKSKSSNRSRQHSKR